MFGAKRFRSANIVAFVLSEPAKTLPERISGQKDLIFFRSMLGHLPKPERKTDYS